MPETGVLPRTASDSTIRSVYSRIARVYGATLERLSRPTRTRAIELLSIQRGETAFDVGCGAGGGVLELGDAVGHEGVAIGLDVAPGMVRETRRRASRSDLGDRTGVVEGDARILPVRTGSIDAVLLSETLDLFDDRDARTVLEEIDRVLSRDGRLCVVSMDRARYPRSRFLRLYEWFYRSVPGGDAFGCRPIDVETTLSAADFEIDTTDEVRLGFGWPVTIALAQPR